MAEVSEEAVIRALERSRLVELVTPSFAGRLVRQALAARLQQWLVDGCTDTEPEVPLDDYGKEVVKQVLRVLQGE